MKLKDKVALVTGAGAGIGRATALLFAKEGANVVVVDYNEDTANETVETIRREGGEAISIKADVSRSQDVRDMIRRTVERYGRLDVLHNNAGIEGEAKPTAEASEEVFDEVIATNLRGVFLGMKYGLLQMLRQGGGVIINTASNAGMIGFRGASAYTASKGGVIQLTRTAAVEYAAENIRINAICPGMVQTGMIQRIASNRGESVSALADRQPVKRLGKPGEIASLALFLASDDSSFVTGAAIVVDGGHSAK